MLTPFLTQSGFRFRNDDGSETGATWIDALNTNVTLEGGTTFRLRIAIDESGGASSSGTWGVRYSLNGGGSVVVSTTSSVVRAVSTSQATCGEATTQQISSGSFTTGELSCTGETSSIEIAANTIELEYVLEIVDADVSENDTITFVVQNGPQALDSYDATPQITIGSSTDVNGSGSPQAGDATASGAGELIFSGAGDVQSGASVASGAGDVANPVSGSGAVQSQDSTASGAGSLIFSGAGSAQAGTSTTSGSGGSTFSGAGAAIAAGVSVVAAGLLIFSGAGSAQAQDSSASGAGAMEGGIGVAVSGPSTASGSGELIFSGAGTALSAEAGGAGVGAIIFSGSGTAMASESSSSGAGSVANHVGAGAGAAGESVGAGVGAIIFSGLGVAQADGAAAQADGELVFIGQGAATADDSSTSGSGTQAESVSGAGVAASSNSTASGVGEVTIDITGVGAAISSDSTANGSGTRLLPVLGIYGTLNGFAHSATVEGEPLFTTDCQISESERNRVASISFIVEEDANSSTAYDAIEIGASVEIAHEMSGDAEDFPFRASTTRESSDTSQTTDTSTLPQPIVQRTTGVVVGVETVHVGAGGKAKLVQIYSETHKATYRRFIDSWPKEGVRTASEIAIDAWERYGSDLGVDTSKVIKYDSPEVGPITSNLDSLFDLMEELALRAGWGWEILDGYLYFYPITDDEGTVWPYDLDQDVNIIGGSLNFGDDAPEIANVAFVPAVVRKEGFQDAQDLDYPLVEQYFTQYPPRRSDNSAPTIYVDGLSIDPESVAEDGADGADEADVIYNVSERFIRFNRSPTSPKGRLVVEYDAEINTVITRMDQASIEVYGVRHGAPITRSQRPSREEAEKIGDRFLLDHAFPVKPIELETTMLGLRPGMYVRLVTHDPAHDALARVVNVTRRVSGADISIAVSLNAIPYTDSDVIFDLFKRMRRMESELTAERTVAEKYQDFDGAWSWRGGFEWTLA